MARMTAHPLPELLRPLGAPDDDELRRCGWFDSTYELHCGLSVTEHVAAEAVAALVPLSWWLQWELEAAAPSVGAGGSSSQRAGH